jgi:molybdenum cofactor cytidylyltransferase
VKPKNAEPARRPRIAALVLAAGHSRRMASANKLLMPWQGRPLLRHAVEGVLASAAERVFVVTGHQGEAVAASLSGLRVLPETIDGVLVCLGDMPRVAAQTLDRLIAAFAPAEGRAICLPTHHGKRGNPVLLGRQLFPALATLEGDRGARRLIESHNELVAEVAVEDAGVLLDVDTPAALAELIGEDTRIFQGS